MRGRYAGIRGVPDEGSLMTRTVVRPLAFLSKQNTAVVTVIEREGRGHPGYLVRCLETNDIYPSQTAAAKALDIPPSVITDHINGKFPDAHGFHIERIAISQN